MVQREVEGPRWVACRLSNTSDVLTVTDRRPARNREVGEGFW